MNNIIRGLVLADMHWGAIDVTEFESELNKTLFVELDNLIKDNDCLEFAAIAGDLFDSKQYISSDVLMYTARFLVKLLLKLSQLGCDTLYIIEGTRNHDSGQPVVLSEIINMAQSGLLSMLQSTMPGTKIMVIEHVQYLRIQDKIDVLFLPEEYVADQEVFYAEYFNRHYDFIIGHGMLDKIWYANATRKQHEENKVLSAPVFQVAKLQELANYSYFGHVHVHRKYGTVQYVGPVTRWEFGKEDPVGFVMFVYDTEQERMVEETFIENNYAPILPTYLINIKETDTIITISDEIDSILANALNIKADRVRLIVNLNSKNSNHLGIKDTIIKRADSIDFLKLVLIDDLPDDYMNAAKEVMEEKLEKIKYVFDRGMAIEQKIKNFIKSHSGKELSIEEIEKYLSKED